MRTISNYLSRSRRSRQRSLGYEAGGRPSDIDSDEADADSFFAGLRLNDIGPDIAYAYTRQVPRDWPGTVGGGTPPSPRDLSGWGSESDPL